MPPKAKFQREEIISAGFEIVRKDGWKALTARALGAKLGSSVCPIFTIFQNMEEVQGEVEETAKARYKEYVEKGLKETPAFKGVGMQYIAFAQNEPQLFQHLFMEKQKDTLNITGILPIIEESYDNILASIQNGYGIEKALAEKLYRHLWIYTHGIATLCATQMCNFTKEEISQMMTDVFVSLLKRIKEDV